MVKRRFIGSKVRGGKTKVADLDTAFMVDEQVGRLEVTMHNPKRGHVGECFENLTEQTPRIFFRETTRDGLGKGVIDEMS